MSDILNALERIQQKLSVPKSLFNNFGGYSYRTAEGIMEAVKPLCAEVNATITLDDDIVAIGGRVYVKSTATLTSTKSGESFSTHAFAREEETKKGMDVAQITGAASSYARKYALNALLAIDDNKDPDVTNRHEEKEDYRTLNDSEITATIEWAANQHPHALQNVLKRWGRKLEDVKLSEKLKLASDVKAEARKIVEDKAVDLAKIFKETKNNQQKEA